MTMHIYPHNANSKGAKALAQELGILRIRHNNSNFRGDMSKTVINWGSSMLPMEVTLANVINDVESVYMAQNKLKCLTALGIHNISIPEFTTDTAVACGWIRNGGMVVCRTLMRASAGRGIILARTVADVVPAPLYTRYQSKKHEYRIHVMNGEIIDVQRKAVKKDSVDNNFQIRTHDNGFIYMREGVVAPDDACEYAVKAVAALGLDFGAVDIIWNERQNKSYVLEVNTAPGLEGTTVETYARAIERNYV